MAALKSEIRNQKSAMTLIELLVSMSVVAILMLGGVAVYFRMNRGFALQAATSAIESSLRSARAFAVHERSPAIVVAEPRADAANLVGLVYALGRQTVSNWHFEKEQFAGGKVLGALGQEATVTGTATPTPGRIGTALLLDGATTSLQVSSPYLDGLREGVFIEADVWPDPTALTTGAILSIVCKDAWGPSNCRLALVGSHPNYFTLSGAVRVGDGGSGLLISCAGETPVPPGEWSHVAMAYYRDGRDAGGNNIGTLVLRVNGQEESPLRNTPPGATMLLAPNTQPLNIGTDGTNRFKGRIDELKIAGLVAGETFELPKNTEVTLDSGGSRDGRVHFDGEGRLDRTQHTRPVLFRIISAEDRLLRSVRVNWLGCVEVFQGDPPTDQ